MSMKTYKGGCFCGAIKIEVSGEPVGMGYCHCADCRSWAAAPVNAFSLWKPESVRITEGEDNVGVYHKTERSYRKFCTICGGHLMTDHPLLKLIDVYAAVIPDFQHKAAVHVHYQETVLPIHDGVIKMKNVPAEMGGTGEILPE